MDARAPVAKERGGFGYRYTQGGEALDVSDMVTKLEQEPKAAEKLAGYDGMSTAAVVAGSAGGALIGWPIGTAMVGGDPMWILAAIGAGLVLLSIPPALSAAGKLSDAVDAHNAGLDMPHEAPWTGYGASVETGQQLHPVAPGSRYGSIDVRARSLGRAEQPATEIRADVIVGGVVVGSTPHAISLPAGAYTVVVRHPDGRDARFRVDVRPERTQELRADFPPPLTDAEREAIEAERRVRRERAREAALVRWQAEHDAWEKDSAGVSEARTPYTTWIWVTAGVGVALVGTGTYLVVEADQADGDARDAALRWESTVDEGTREAIEERIRDAQDRRDLYGVVGGSLLASGGASLAASLVLLIARPGYAEEPVRPLATREGWGLRWSVRF